MYFLRCHSILKQIELIFTPFFCLFTSFFVASIIASMKAHFTRLFQRFFIPLFLTITPFVYADEKPFTISCKAINLARLAAVEMNKKTTEALDRAIQLLEATIQEPSFKRLPMDEELPIFLDLATAYHKKKAFLKEEQLLKSLILNPLLEPFLIKLKSVLATSFIKQSKLDPAEEILRECLGIHPKTLSQEERQEIAALWNRLDRHYYFLWNQSQQLLASKIGQKANQEAITHLELLLRQTEKGLFPKTTSLQQKESSQTRLREQLAQAYMAENQYEKAIHLLKQEPIQQGSRCRPLLALCQKKAGLLQEALSTIESEIEKNPQTPKSDPLYFLAFEIALQTNQEAKAKLFCSKLSNSHFASRAALLHAEKAATLGRSQEARTLLTLLVRSEVAAEALFLKSKILMKEKEHEEAIIHLEQALSEKKLDSITLKEKIIQLLITAYLELSYDTEGANRAYLERAETLARELPLPLATTELARVTFFRSAILHEKSAYPIEATTTESQLLKALQPGKTQEEKRAQLAALDTPQATLFRALLDSNTKEEAAKAQKLLQTLPESEEKELLLIETLRIHDPQEACRVSQQFSQKYPKSRWGAYIQHILAQLYFEAGNTTGAIATLEEAIRTYPTYDAHDAMMHFLVFCYGKSQPEKTRLMRKELIAQHPNSAFCPEAFFSIFSEADYIHGTPQSQRHLEELVARFNNSRFTAVAYFYLGVHAAQKDQALSKTYFQHALTLAQNEKTASPKVELATLLQLGQFADSDAELALKKLLVLSPSCHEARLLLAKTYQTSQRLELARKQLISLIESSDSSFQAKAGLQLGVMEAEVEKHKEAIKHFDKAERVAVKELLLQVRLAKSDCLRKMGKLDEAMTLLSQVINDETASQLRIKAGFMRAEIYEEQKRYELALKQLEAVKNFGGEWGTKAKEKLELSYGYN